MCFFFAICDFAQKQKCAKKKTFKTAQKQLKKKIQKQKKNEKLYTCSIPVLGFVNIVGICIIILDKCEESARWSAVTLGEKTCYIIIGILCLPLSFLIFTILTEFTCFIIITLFLYVKHYYRFETNNNKNEQRIVSNFRFVSVG